MVYEDVEVNGVIKRNYTLIQGDNFAGTVAIRQDGLNVDGSKIDTLKFKLSDRNYNLLYEQTLEYNENDKKWYINIPSAVSKEIGVGRYIYEYELTLVGGFVTTIMQANFKITNEIKGE